MKWSRIASALLLGGSMALMGCDVDVEDEGKLPEVDVDAEPGELPDVDVRGPDVEVDSEQKEIEVPDVDVETEKETITVPDVDVDLPEE